MAGEPKTIFDLKITVRGQLDQPWRIVAVRADTPLRRLHFILQLAMDWRCLVDYVFVFGTKRVESDKFPRSPLQRFAGVGDTFEYSASDGLWRPHDVAILASYEVASRRHYPKCLDGTGVIPEAASEPFRSKFSVQSTTWHFDAVPVLEAEWKQRIASTATKPGNAAVTGAGYSPPGGTPWDVENFTLEGTMQATVRLTQPVSDEDLERISRENPGWQIEREGLGSLLMSPTTSAGSSKNFELSYQFAAWVKRYGGVGFDASGGFTLPDGSVFSPDAAWIAGERWSALSAKVRDSYAPIVPDIWIELRSKTDNPAKLKAKLERVRSFGASYVLLIDPYERSTWSSGEAPTTFALDYEAIYDA
jgi:Uma2 family endonuclease